MSPFHTIRRITLQSWVWWGVVCLLFIIMTISWRGADSAGRIFVYPVTQETTYRHMAESYVKLYCPLEYAELEKPFFEFATSKGMVGIKGHRSVGGFRASCYNAQPLEGVQALVDCMKEFEAKL